MAPTQRPPTGPPARKPTTAPPRKRSGVAVPANASRRDRRQAKDQAAINARQRRWNSSRFSIPYPTDGPKVMLGLFWFSLIIGATYASELLENATVTPVAVAVIASAVAGIAGLQIGNAWFGAKKEIRAWPALASYVAAVAGFMGVIGVGIGLGAAVVILVLGSVATSDRSRSSGELLDVLLRAGLPAGVAASSMAALAALEINSDSSSSASALATMIFLVSAYEAGDFVVGSGANNAIEGPLSGIITLSVIGFGFAIVPPHAFASSGLRVVLFAALTAICCPMGQMLGSILLPKSTAWAPALRRLDSYLITAPVWLLLMTQIIS